MSNTAPNMIDVLKDFKEIFDETPRASSSEPKFPFNGATRLAVSPDIYDAIVRSRRLDGDYAPVKEWVGLPIYSNQMLGTETVVGFRGLEMVWCNRFDVEEVRSVPLVAVTDRVGVAA